MTSKHYNSFFPNPLVLAEARPFVREKLKGVGKNGINSFNDELLNESKIRKEK